MRLAPIACLVVTSMTSTTAVAEPLGVAVGKGGYLVDRVALDITPARDGARIAMTVALRATNPGAQLVEVPLDVPHGARVVALRLAHGDGRAAVATATPADEARDRWREHVQRSDRDPVLLAYEETRNGMDRLELRIYPIQARQAATVELAFDVPLTAAASLELDPRNQTVERLDVRVGGAAARTVHAWKRVELVALAPAPVAAALPPARAVVGPGTSLLGAAPPSVPRVAIPEPAVVSCTFGNDRKIRRVVRNHTAQLRRCYTSVAQWSPGIEGAAVAHFRIEPDGRVSKAVVDGTLAEPRITTCLARVFAAMEFPGDAAATEVNYPITFRMTE